MKKGKSNSYVLSGEGGIITTITTLQPKGKGFKIYIAQAPSKFFHDNKISKVQIITEEERGLLVIMPISESGLRKRLAEGEHIAGLK